jgi:hypothetical protein
MAIRAMPWRQHGGEKTASYRCNAMAIKIAIDLPAFFVAVDSLSPTTIAI